jgi:hypothetical protein
VRFSKDCQLCMLQPAADVSIEYVSDVAIAFVEPERCGASLAPRAHVGSLSDLGADAGAFLAALRRAANEIQAVYGTTGTMIEPTTALPGAAGHVTYRIVPTLLEEDGNAEAKRKRSQQLTAALEGLGTDA